MLSFHEDHKKNALHQILGIYEARNGLYKTLYEKGYVPVTKRGEYLRRNNSPERHAVKVLRSVNQNW